MYRNLCAALVGRFDFRFVYSPMPDLSVEHCPCENSLCTAGHVKRGEGRKRPYLSGCKGTIIPGDMDGTPERPWMAYLGVVCIPCAQSMAATGAPGYVSAPYGTMAFEVRPAGQG